MKTKKILSSVVLAATMLLNFSGTVMAVTVSGPVDIDVTHILQDMVVDSSGNVHAVVVAPIGGGSSYNLKYMKYNGTSWSTATMNIGASGYSYNARIALDSTGNPGIAWAYRNDPAQYLYYIKYADNAWGTKVEVSGDADMGTSSGNPALAFYKSNTQGAADLDYPTIFTCNGSTYAVEQHKGNASDIEATFLAPTSAGNMSCSSLDVDISETDTIRLVTSPASGGDGIAYTYYHDGSSWDSGNGTSIFTSIDVVNESLIYMDSDNNSSDFHVVMIDDVSSGDDKILYNKFTGGSWAGQETITGATGAGIGKDQIDVVVDNDYDIPYVFYFDNANSALEYSYKADGSWTNGSIHEGLSLNTGYYNHVAADYDAGNMKIIALGSTVLPDVSFDFNKYELTDLVGQGGVPEFSTYVYTMTALMLFGMVYWKSEGGKLVGA